MTPRSRADSTTLTLDDRIRMSLTSTWLICCPDPSHTTSVFAGFSRNLLADNHELISSMKTAGSLYGPCCITDRNADVYWTVVGVLMETHTVTHFYISYYSLPRDAMHKRGLCRHGHAVSVCVFLSHSWVVSKRINISSKNFHHIGQPHHSSF